MLIEKQIFNFHEVGEKSFEEIKNECLVHFAVSLKEALISSQEHIRKFWSESSIANYKIFNDLFSSMIKYNSKNIVFEEVLHNGMNKPWSLQQTFMDVCGLEYVQPTEEASGYYKLRNDIPTLRCDTCCMATVDEESNLSKESIKRIENFYTSFGVGEFPFMTVTLIRLGNKDHYFYNIHR